MSLKRVEWDSNWQNICITCINWDKPDHLGKGFKWASYTYFPSFLVRN